MRACAYTCVTEDDEDDEGEAGDVGFREEIIGGTGTR